MRCYGLSKKKNVHRTNIRREWSNFSSERKKPQKTHSTEAVCIEPLDLIVWHVQHSENWITSKRSSVKNCKNTQLIMMSRGVNVKIMKQKNHKSSSYRVISVNALCDTLHQPNFVKSATCDESSLVSWLWLMSSTSSSRKFLNWFRFSSVKRLPCKSNVFNLRKSCKWIQINHEWFFSTFATFKNEIDFNSPTVGA